MSTGLSGEDLLNLIGGEKERRATVLARDNFTDFFRLAWHVMEPGRPLVWGWHLDAICEHLQAVSMGQIKRLLITEPPGHCKPVHHEAPVIIHSKDRRYRSVPLREVVAGDLVLTHLGRFRKVEAVHLQGALDIVEVTSTNGHSVKVATDHPFLTSRGWIRANQMVDGEIVATANSFLLPQLTGDRMFRGLSRDLLHKDFLACLESCQFHPTTVASVEPAARDECRCLTVEEDESFTAGRFAVHNSLSVSVAWPAWQWIEKNLKKFPFSGPKWRSIATSYSEALATRDSVRCRALLESPWFQTSFAPKWEWSSDQNIKTWFENSEKGSRISLGVGGSATGIRADALICDDPLNAKDQFSAAVLENAIFWWDQVMSSRLNDMATGAKIIIMQRLSESDLAQHVIEQGGYDHLNLMTEFEPERRTTTSIGWSDPRKEAGELLFPAMFGKEVVAGVKKDLGSAGFSAQHQQRPSPAEGGTLKRTWWRYWKRPGDPWGPVRIRMETGEWLTVPVVELPGMEEMAQSWDMSFKNVKDADYVVGQIWGRRGAGRYFIHQVRARMDMPQTMAAVRLMTRQYPMAVMKLVEDKANGPAVIAMLRNEIPGMVAVNPEGGKEARAAAVAPTVEAGNVFLPHPLMCPWVDAFVDECAAFPRGKFDDSVDAATQVLRRWLAGGHLGVIEFIQQEIMREVEVKRKEAIEVAAQTERCGKCSSVGVRYMGRGQGYQCQQCGHQWGSNMKVEHPNRLHGAAKQKMLGAGK